MDECMYWPMVPADEYNICIVHFSLIMKSSCKISKNVSSRYADVWIGCFGSKYE